MRGSIDYSINYSALGFFPVTNAQAGPIVNAWAAAQGGWDYIRSLPLGYYENEYFDGQTYYSFSLEDATGTPLINDSGQSVPNSGDSVYIYVYDMTDPNSVSSAKSMGQIQSNLTASLAANAAATNPANLLSNLFSGIIPYLVVGGLILFMLYSSERHSS